MRAALQQTRDRKILQELVPLNALSEERFQELAGKIIVEEVRAGRYLFRKGDRDNQSIYLLDGKVSLTDGSRKVVSEIEAGSDASRFPLAAQQPRPLSARVSRKAVIARIDSGLLDVFLTWDQSNTAEVVDINLAENSDWMTRLLQSDAFSQLPPAKLQGLLIRMRPVAVRRGQAIIRQGSPGDYFYTIHEGRCEVTRKAPDGGGELKLAELTAGDCFGEDALVSGAARNATVTMLTDGQLMRLAKQDFEDLLHTELVRHVRIEQALQMVEEGAVWLDVRTSDEYQQDAFEDSVNIPLAMLRREIPELVFNAKYIICCDTGRRSESAGFLLSHRGFEVYVLDGGIAAAQAYLTPSVEPEDTGAEGAESPDDVASEISPALSLVLEDAAQEYAELQTAYDELQEQFASLQAERHDHAREQQRLTALLAQLRAELDRSATAESGLHARISELEEEKRLLGGQYGAVSAEQLDQLQTAEIDLEQERHKCVSLQREVEALSGERAMLSQQLAAGRHEVQGAIDTLQARLAESQQQVAGLQAGMAGASAENDRLQQENQRISGALAELQATHASTGDALTGRDAMLDELRNANTALEQRLAAVQSEFDALRAVHEGAVAESGGRDELVEELRSGNAALEQELGSSRTVLAEVQAQIETLRAESAEQLAAERRTREETEQRLHELQGRHASAAAGVEKSMETVAGLQAENSRLQDSLDEVNASNGQLSDKVAGLQADLEAVTAARATAEAEWAQVRTGLQSQLDEQQSQAGKLREELEQKHLDEVERNIAALEQRDQQIADMGLKLAAVTEQLELALSDRQRLADELAELHAARNADGEKFAALQDGLGRTVASMGQQAAELQSQVAASEEQLAALRLEVERHEAARVARDQELEQAQARIQELQQAQAVSGEQVKALEQSLQETERKAHEDIRRKNENEKELQAQAERLRKKLEQVTGDFQKSRKDAQADLDSLREELHTEREARDDERAQMAARQRELKEQLASIASEHEVHVNRNSGVIEEAVDAVREEERSRLQGVLDAQVATEQMLEKVQAELRQAHAELAEYHRQEKDRRQVDIDLIEEQNRQAEAAISQLQSQLRHLTKERDESLEQQQVLRERVDSLRGEVETARDQVASFTQDRIEAPAQLRAQLEESHRNEEIAVRLRAEAEAARDRMREERDRLLAQAGERVPAAAAGTDSAALTSPHPAPVQQPLRADGAAPSFSTVTFAAVRRVLRWLVAAGGILMLLLAAGLAWLVFWQTPRGPVGHPVHVERSVPESAVVTAPANPPVESAPSSQDTPSAQPGPVAAQTAGPAAKVAREPVPAPVKAKPVAPVQTSPVLRTYSDALRDGGRGPEMVQLAAATYQMGSIGNSMNAEEVPRHEVKLASFSISRYEVTFAEYDRYARATGQQLPHDESWGRDRQPVINVSWNDAVGYVKWLSAQTGRDYRLPSEAQWEYAARAGSDGSYWWTDTKAGIPANCFNCGSSWDGARTAPVGQFAANGFGLYDMAGNVQEWTADCYHPNYAGAPADGSAWGGDVYCTQRVVRGGAYSSPLDSLRSARRADLAEDTSLDNLGFRVVRVD
jgi:formylglycine-generating enzyme required for sulfatase activity/CRP-like cAMP-binding protein/chromosome segregation ATPase